MRNENDRIAASRTAEWVAAARSLGVLLPPELRLAHDPYGLRFVDGRERRLGDALLRNGRLSAALADRAGPLTSFLLWMQLRTRALDDVLLDFVKAGRQVVLLGAGYDSRALRFGRELSDAVVFEVDHPATQSRKLARLPAETMKNRVVYASWDFERNEVAALPFRLRELGLDPEAPTLTIWEGVTMYLREQAVDETVRAVRAYSSPASLLALTYIDKRAILRPRGEHGLLQRIVASAGEPWRFGFYPEHVGSWFRDRGFELSSDATDAGLAARFYPPDVGRRFEKRTRHVAVFEVRARG